MEASIPQRPRFDTTIPHLGRVADYIRGGKDNFAADRRAAETAMTIAPELPVLWRETRRFLGRMVRYLAAEAGIRQFVDIGCGLPSRDNVHEIADTVAPGARVVYVDNDPVAVAHGQALLQDERRTVVIEADARDPEALLSHPRLTGLIDLDEPVAFLLFGVLPEIPEDDVAARIVGHLRDRLVPGGHLALSHQVSDPCPETTARLTAFYRREGAIPRFHRDNLRRRAEVGRFFDGLTLVDPGLVYVPWWRPEREVPYPPDAVWVAGGVARKD